MSNLLYVALIRAHGIECGFDKIVEEGNSLRLYSEEIDTDVWMVMANEYRGSLKLLAAPSEHIMVKMPSGCNTCDFLYALLKKYLEIKNG